METLLIPSSTFPRQIKIESLGYEIFSAFTKGEVWNGWDCPYFIFEQAQKVLKTHNIFRSIVGDKKISYYDLERDAFIFPVTGKDESEIFAAIIENGEKYYPIGTFCWIWEETLE